MIRFRRRRNKLPLFERELQSLKTELRQYSLLKVQFATKTLPKDFFVFFRKKQPIFARKIGSCSRLYVATRQGYLATNSHRQFHAKMRSGENFVTKCLYLFRLTRTTTVV